VLLSLIKSVIHKWFSDGYTGLKIHPVRMAGSNESGQDVSMVPVTEPK
jgi:hypothetical protein